MSPKFLLFFIAITYYNNADGLLYDSSAFIECEIEPADPLYGGGLLASNLTASSNDTILFELQDLKVDTKYCFSVWVKLSHSSPDSSSFVRASLEADTFNKSCIGTVIAKSGCWSFLKGGFDVATASESAKIYLQKSYINNFTIEVASVSLQPFTDEEWTANQQLMIKASRKRDVIIRVLNESGFSVPGVTMTVEQLSKAFPFGAAIDSSIIKNSSYQKWFADRFNVAAMSNELKWAFTEKIQGHINYDFPDKMLEFLEANQIQVRGHCILWESVYGLPLWVRNLTDAELRSAVDSRIQSVMSRYKGRFFHWDVDNEELHSDYLSGRLGENITLQTFKTVHQADPTAILFENEYNVVELCDNEVSTVDSYILRLRELQQGGAEMLGVGLQSHFGVPNSPLMRAVLDKFAILGLPIWLTELDISNQRQSESDPVVLTRQAKYLEVVLREAFSHPAVNGLVLWTAFNPLQNPRPCYKMCLTDGEFQNFPTGKVVDSLLKEWETQLVEGKTDWLGQLGLSGFLGEYEVNVTDFFGNTGSYTFTLTRGTGPQLWTITV